MLCLLLFLADYESPYSVEFTHPLKELLVGLDDDPKRQSSVPSADWYSDTTKKRWGAWGPPARTFIVPDAISKKPAAWKRERVLAVALRFRGYGYQHHHIPDWDPPKGWPWKEVSSGKNGKGVDCSNFTSFAYNQALGMKFTSDVGKQADVEKLTRIVKPKAFGDCGKAFRTGDLLFIKNKDGKVSHVVLWVGSVGKSPDGAALVLDSTDTVRTDSAGKKIPTGVELRPFRESGWYWKCLSHARRPVSE